jgi:uncharacterized protein YndB with AHSA1/START domain
MERSTRHETFEIEREFDAPRPRVFHAWKDVEVRKRWQVPEGNGIEFVAADFRIGGSDVLKCGPEGDLRYTITGHYHDIVEGERIIYAETVDEDGIRSAVSITTVELRDAGRKTALKVTSQLTALDGSDIVEGNKEGWGMVLDNLARELQRVPAMGPASV